MVLRIATCDYFATLEDFATHLPPSLDSELLVLKGHLLIERLLENYLVLNLPNSRELDDARFTFAHKLAVTAALCKDQEAKPLWKSIRLLNNLRNELSHQLESSRKESLTLEFIRSVDRSPEMSEIGAPPEVTETLHRAIFAVHEALSMRVNL